MRKIASLLAVLLLFTALAFGQDRTITGTVIDETGPLYLEHLSKSKEQGQVWLLTIMASFVFWLKAETFY